MVTTKATKLIKSVVNNLLFNDKLIIPYEAMQTIKDKMKLYELKHEGFNKHISNPINPNWLNLPVFVLVNITLKYVLKSTLKQP